MKIDGPLQPTIGAPVDVGPFAEESFGTETERGFVWATPRDIERVLIVWHDSHPDPNDLRIEYWHSAWPEHRVEGSGSGQSGWEHEGDWFNGEWLEADTRCEPGPKSGNWTFASISEKEFTNGTCAGFPATFRRTFKLRVVSKNPLPEISSIQVLTPSTWCRQRVSITWEDKRHADTDRDDVSIVNGHVTDFQSSDDCVTLDLLTPISTRPDTYDRAVITIRDSHASFSFAVDDLADGPLLLSDFGALISAQEDHLSYEDHCAAIASLQPDIYERVFQEPEQTFERAWRELPAKTSFYMVLGVEGRRHRFKVHPTGDIERDSGEFAVKAPASDTQRFADDAGRVTWEFGLPQAPFTTRSLDRGYLPIITTEWEYGGLKYSQTALATLLDRSLDSVPIRGDDTVVGLVRLAVTNRDMHVRNGDLRISTAHNGETEPLTVADRRVVADPGGKLRALILDATPGHSISSSTDGGVSVSYSLMPGETAHVDFVLPMFAPTEDETARAEAQTFDTARVNVADYWQQRIDSGTKLHTSIPLLDDFWKSHVTHLLINHERHPATQNDDHPCDVPRVGSFAYGSYANESIMQNSDLDRRGFHREAERGYELYLKYQSSVALSGDYRSVQGVFNGAGGYECLSYNQNHGWVLWGIAEHYFMTRDADWLARVADNVVAGCDWIIRERGRTMTERADGTRPIEFGFLPAGELEDIRDFRYWLSTNVYTWWGLTAAARALSSVEHPESERLTAESNAMGKDLLAGFDEAMVRSPIVRLRNGAAVPHYPVHQHLRGRAYGWIRETLEGAIHLVRCGLVDPQSTRAKWILRDYEDNLYLSSEYGYSVRDFETQWFSRGGFSMQPNLLCGPLPYLLRDEIKHFVRATINGIAAGLHADTRMLTEHPLPELGDWFGDHFKTSDEANAAYWLRLMFIHERGEFLHLGWGVPRSWLRDRVPIGIDNAATHFGPASIKITPRDGCRRVDVEIDPPCRNLPAQMLLRIRHPSRATIRNVQVDDQTWHDFDTDSEHVTLPPLKNRTRISIYYH